MKIIHHRSDFDGIFCREIAKKFLGPEYEIVGYEYGDKIPEVMEDELIYMLDISIPELMNHTRLNWIDHHKTAMDKFGLKPGFQIDGVAACRLAWQYFNEEPPNFANRGENQKTMPSKNDFVERWVVEPLSVRLAGEYDIWDKRDPNTDLFQHGLRSEELDWSKMFYDESYVKKLLEQGKALQYYKQKEDESIIKNNGFELKWEELNFLVLNSARFNSLSFDSRVTKDHDALLGFKWTGDKWIISLYHTPFNKEIDLSKIAIKYGGGGHKGACGFTCKTLPFNL